MPDVRAAGPFSRWERSVARRYLFAKRKNGGVALISVISFSAVMLSTSTVTLRAFPNNAIPSNKPISRSKPPPYTTTAGHTGYVTFSNRGTRVTDAPAAIVGRNTSGSGSPGNNSCMRAMKAGDTSNRWSSRRMSIAPCRS